MEWLTENLPALAYTLATFLGAGAHWFKKAYRGDVTWNPIDYLLADHPGRTGFTLGALVVSAWAVVFSGTLEGMQTHAVVAMGFGLGWAIDSGVNKGGPGRGRSSVSVSGRQAGYVAGVWPLIVLAALVIGLVGCSGLGVKPPENRLEVLEQIEIGAQELQRQIADLTCTEFAGGECIEPGMLDPDTTRAAFEKVARVRAGVAAVHRIGDGSGACLGETRTALDCLRASQSLLLEAQQFVNRERGQL